MADYHLSMTALSRRSGRSSVAAAAYRAGVRLLDTRTGLAHDYERKRGVTASFVALPEGAPEWASERGRLWDAVEAAEKRVDANTAREITVALPAELGEGAREGLARALAARLVERFGVAVDGAVHAPSAQGDQRNHHAHLLFTTRRMEAGGLGAKTRELNDRKTGPEAIRELRAWWAGACNEALAEAGSEARVDHRSHAARRAALEAQAQAGEAEAERLEQPGVLTRLTSRAESRRERAEAARKAAEAARASAALLGPPTQHQGPARTAVMRTEARIEAERQAEAKRLEAEAAAEREKAEVALRDRKAREAALRAAQEAVETHARREAARAWVHERLAAGGEGGRPPPNVEEFGDRLGFDRETGPLWAEAHDGWFEGLAVRFERERPGYDPQGPLGTPAGALFEDPAWREHATQAAAWSRLWMRERPLPGYRAFRAVVLRVEAEQEEAARTARVARMRAEAPRSVPEAPEPSSWRPRGP